MLFNSIQFALFLPIVFCLHWLWPGSNRPRLQNLILLAASYFFYGCWDYRFLFLLGFSTLLDYVAGILIHRGKSQGERKVWLCLSVGVNLSFLGFFKYYNFFATSFAAALANFGVNVDPWTVRVILPVGISFYTFHGLSYVFDIYRRRIEPERNFVDYALFVSFFPLLVAGPIERATHLLPQLKRPRIFDEAKAVDGMRQILWGLFKKVAIADNCATFANIVFENPAAFSRGSHAIGVIFFAFQIYCDFSGYSDIALGTARLFGIELLRNFGFPYFSRDIAEFWRRWHISLTTWFRDYVYIPLGGSKVSQAKRVRNIFVIFLLSGFWHGANWTFIVWGALNALYFLPLLLTAKNRAHLGTVAEGRLIPSLREVTGMATTFALTAVTWVFFRCDTVGGAVQYLSGFVSPGSRPLPMRPGMVSLLLAAFVCVEWLGREQPYAIAKLGMHPSGVLRWGFYLVILGVSFVFAGQPQQFIYFQF